MKFVVEVEADEGETVAEVKTQVEGGLRGGTYLEGVKVAFLDPDRARRAAWLVLDGEFIFAGENTKAGHPLFLLSKKVSFDMLAEKILKAADPLKS